MQTVEPYLSHELMTVPPSADIASMNASFANGTHRHLIVVREDGGLVGVVRRAAVQAASDRPETTADQLLAGALVLSSTSRLADALEALSQEPEDIVIAVDDAMRPVGVLTEHDGIRLATRQLPRTLCAGEVGAREQVETIAWDAPVREAHQKMHDRDIRHLVVVDGERPIGVISERDLVAHGALRNPDQGVAGILPDGQFRTSSPEACLVDIAERMHNKKIGSIALLQEGKLMGIVTRTDVIRALLAEVRDAT